MGDINVSDCSGKAHCLQYCAANCHGIICVVRRSNDTFSVVSIFNFSLENIHIEKNLKNKYEKIFPFLF